MIKAIILDLDYIIPNISVTRINKSLVQALSAHFTTSGLPLEAAFVYAEAVELMSDPDRPADLTNYQILAKVITEHHTNINPEQLLASLFSFYNSPQFNTGDCVSTDNVASNDLGKILDSDLEIVLAVDPIYSQPIIQSWLGIQGMPIDFERYSFVTHAQNMHFLKSDPAYYAEVIARVGVEPDETLYCSGNYLDSIQVAQSLGFYTFQIMQKTDSLDETKGSYENLSALIDRSYWDHAVPYVRLTPQMIEPQLRGNLGAMFGILYDAKKHHWHQHPDITEWSIHQIICHLRESEYNVQRPRLEKILSEDNPFITSPLPPEGPETMNCPGDGMQIAYEFVNARKETITRLRGLSTTDWNRPARHSLFGPTTLLEMAHFTAQHDRLHLAQLCQTLGKCD